MVAHRRVFDAIVRHRVDLQRYARGEAAAVVSLLANEDAKLIGMLRDRLPHLKPQDVNAARIKALLASVKEQRMESYRAVHARMRDDLTELAKVEADTIGRMATGALRAPIVFNPIRASILRGAVLKEPFAGGANASRTLSQWVAKLAVDDRQRLLGAVQMGVKRMDTVDQMVRRVAGTRAAGYRDGVLAISRRDAETAVRTAVIHVANAAQVEWNKANKDVVAGAEWVAMLDERLCPTCSERDGKTTEDVPPAHPRCRCTLTPSLDLDRLAARLPDRIEGVGDVREPEPTANTNTPAPPPKAPPLNTNKLESAQFASNVHLAPHLAGKASRRAAEFDEGLRAMTGGKCTLADLTHCFSPPPGYSLRVDDLTASKGKATFTASILDKQGRVISDGFTRKIHLDPDGSPFVYHAFFKLDPAHQGAGIGDHMMASALSRYEKLGFVRVETSPHWVGRYQWAKVGFVPDDDSRARLRDELELFLMRPRHGLTAKQQATTLQAFDSMTLQEFSQVKGRTYHHVNEDARESDSDHATLGKAFLLDRDTSPWHGSIDIPSKDLDKALAMVTRKKP